MKAALVGSIVLAAGSSSRLGEPKQFLRYQEETLIRRAAGAAIDAGCWPVVVVSGAAHERVERELEPLAVHVRHNENWGQGIGSSIRIGAESALDLCPSLDALLVMVCDQPFVTAELLAALIDAGSASPARAVACAYGDAFGVPVLFRRKHFTALAALGDEQGAKSLLSALGSELVVIPFPEGKVDIDTPADVHEHLTSR